MMNASMRSRICLFFMLACFLNTPPAAHAQGKAKTKANAVKRISPSQKQALDRSGKPRKGKASFYGPGFEGKPMADGTPMNPQTSITTSRTLPLGNQGQSDKPGKRKKLGGRNQGSRSVC